MTQPIRQMEQSDDVAPGLMRRTRIALLATGAAWLLGCRAAVQLLSGLLVSSPWVGAVLGALVVDLAAGRAKISWSDDEAPRAVLVRRVARAAGAAAGVAIIALFVAVVCGWAVVHAGHPDALLLMSIVGVGAAAIRDELLLRAIPLHFARRAEVPVPAAMIFAASLSPTAFLLSGATPANVLLSFALGLLFAAAYTHLGGAYAAIGSHAAWSLLVGPLTSGGVVEVHWQRGDLSDGPGGDLAASASGPPAYVAAAIALVAALLVLPRLVRGVVWHRDPVAETPERGPEKRSRGRGRQKKKRPPADAPNPDG